MRLAAALAICATCLSCGPRTPSQDTVTVTPAPLPTADTCNASPYVYLIGEDATALERVLILRPVRVNWPEDRADGSSKPERLNFNISAQGRIESLTCG